ncbi:MAG: DUF4013 domain-containing protein [Anaerolineae bacterium]
MDYGKSFSYMFKDKDWLMKIILGGVFILLSAILVGIPFVLGYILEVVRNVAAGRDEELPAWDNLGDKFVQGLMLLVVLLIISIPLWLFSCVMGVFNGIAASSSSDALQTLAALVSVLMWLLNVLYGLIFAIFMPAFMIRYAMTRDFGATLKIGEAWKVIKANFGNYILIIIIAWVAQVVASFGVIACVIGVFLTYFWAYLVQGHLLGQYYRNYVAPAPMMPGQAPMAPMGQM